MEAPDQELDELTRARREGRARRIQRIDGSLRRDEMRRVFDTEGDWGKLLAMFAAAATTGATG